MQRSRICWLAIALIVSLALAGCGGSDGTSGDTSADIPASKGTTDAPIAEGVKPEVVVPPGPPPSSLVVTDLRKGAGQKAKAGPYLTVQFVALRWSGEPFQSSWDNGKFQPFTFKLGVRPPQVAPGWEQGLPGMREGGRRKLVLPPKYIYSREVGPEYREPSDTLVYVVELLQVGGS